jgi:hypothetical protein
MTKIAGYGSASGSISQRHGSADPDPDPPQNVMDLQHWLRGTMPRQSVVGENLNKFKIPSWGCKLFEKCVKMYAYINIIDCCFFCNRPQEIILSCYVIPS